jgi:hypothetical protein
MIDIDRLACLTLLNIQWRRSGGRFQSELIADEVLH